MQIVDSRGQVCPMPLIMLKKGLQNNKNGDALSILVDNEISVRNILSYLKSNGYASECIVKEEYWVIEISKEMPNISNEIIQTKDQVLVVNRNIMGHGNDELGGILIKGFFTALCEVENKPNKIIFYNSGVLLCRFSYSDVASLQKLANQGVDLILCGACVDFFQIKDEICVGRISNMLAICEILTGCEKIIYV